MRRGLRPSPRRSGGESGAGTRTEFTATSNRAVGPPRGLGGDDESAHVTGDRDGRGVRPGPRPPSGGRGRRRPAGVSAGHGATRSRWAVQRGDRVRSPPDGRRTGNGAVVEEPKDLGPPQLDSARSVPYGARTEGSGNRVSVKRCQGSGAGRPASSQTRGIARPAEGRDGRCEQVESKANARRSTCGGPVHRAAPGGAQARARSTDRGARHFRPTTPKNRASVAPSATRARELGGNGGQRSIRARRTTWSRSSRARSTVGPGKNATSSASASASA